MAIARVGLLGCGQWGRNLARNLAALGVLRGIADSNPVLLEGVRALYPDVTVTEDASAVLKDPDIDACVIATPAALHFEMARQALEAGKDVFVEKPLALTVKEGEALVAGISTCMLPASSSPRLAKGSGFRCSRRWPVVSLSSPPGSRPFPRSPARPRAG